MVICTDVHTSVYITIRNFFTIVYLNCSLITIMAASQLDVLANENTELASRSKQTA